LNAARVSYTRGEASSAGASSTYGLVSERWGHSQEREYLVQIPADKWRGSRVIKSTVRGCGQTTIGAKVRYTATRVCSYKPYISYLQ